MKPKEKRSIERLVNREDNLQSIVALSRPRQYPSHHNSINGSYICKENSMAPNEEMIVGYIPSNLDKLIDAIKNYFKKKD